MNEIAPFQHAPVRWRLHGWQTIVLFSILEMAFFALPWLILNSAFGGYTAYAIARRA